MGCCEGLLRCFLFLFNAGIMAAGVALIIIGGIAADEFRDYTEVDLFEDKYLWGPVALAFVVGILLIFVGLTGVGGICCKNTCLLKGFIVCLFILGALEVVVCVVVFVYKDEGEKSARTGIQKALPVGYGPNSNTTKTRRVLDKMQKKFDCCGGTNISDYAKSGNLSIPDACCRTFNDGCAREQTPLTKFYSKGCADAMFDKFEKYSIGIFTVSIIFVFIQIVGFFLACKYLAQDN